MHRQASVLPGVIKFFLFIPRSGKKIFPLVVLLFCPAGRWCYPIQDFYISSPVHAAGWMIV
jgi:hypothetical protein